MHTCQALQYDSLGEAHHRSHPPQATRLAQYPNYLNLEEQVKAHEERLEREAVKLQKVCTHLLTGACEHDPPCAVLVLHPRCCARAATWYCLEHMLTGSCFLHAHSPCWVCDVCGSGITGCSSSSSCLQKNARLP